MRTAWRAACLALLFAITARSQEHDHAHVEHAGTDTSAREHVPPAPPQQELPDVSPREMAHMMQMDDAASLGSFTADYLEWRASENADSLAWHANAWYGNDYDKLLLATEGERSERDGTQARIELLWDHVFTRWWNLQGGVRHDLHSGADRNWLAVGVAGLAPHFFAIEAAAYVGEQGRSALRLRAQRELLFTQRLSLQPELELTAYGKNDEINLLGSGLAELSLALRLRYEIRRELAPFIGMEWTRHLGNTADLQRAAGADANQWRTLLGVRIWF